MGSGVENIERATPDVAGQDVTHRFTDGAAHVTQAGAPVAQITPTVASVLTGEIQIDAVGTDEVVGVRMTVNAGDTTVSATRLMNSFPDVETMGIEESVRLKAGSAITKITVVALGTADAAVAYSAPVAGALLPTNSTLANYVTTQVQFDFDSSDEVNTVDLTLIPYSDGTTANNLAQLKIAGYSK